VIDNVFASNPMSFAVSGSGSASLVITMLAKLTVAVCYNVIYFYTGELFPTNIRHLVLATSGALSRIGGIVAPFIIFAGL